MKVACYCRCGARLVGIAPTRNAPKLLAVERLFWQVHTGEGHAPIPFADWCQQAIKRGDYLPGEDTPAYLPEYALEG